MNAGVCGRLVCLAILTALAGAAGEAATKAAPQDARRKASAAPAARRVLRLPDVPYSYARLDLPAHFLQPIAARFDNTPAENPVTDGGATLGRVLFYETRLSANDTTSCGTCHAQKHAFVDPRPVSRGFAGGLTDRHAMNLVNLRYHPRGRFFWDERGETLEAMVLMPIENPVEMGQTLAKLPAVLGREAYYAKLFTDAFGDPAITVDRIGRALAQFLRSMVSYRSRYDEGRASVKTIGDDFPNFTHQENVGKALFMRNCANCHLPNQEAHFVMMEPANTGLDDHAPTVDGGVGDITLNPKDLGRFKSPTLRNVEFTAPYMHDGRFATLEMVLDHYSSGGKNHPNKDVRVQPLHLTASEKAALVSFLKTLTDRTFLDDPKFSDPFDQPS